MRCPRCGEPLSRIVGDPDAADIEDTEDTDGIEDTEDTDSRAWFKGGQLPKVDAKRDESEQWACHNNDCDLSFPCFFNVHHPFFGPLSKPGDSWSISWIK